MINQQIWALIVLAVSFSACRSGDNTMQLGLVNKTLLQTKEILEKENVVLAEGILHGEKESYWTIEHYWGPVADSIQEMSKDVISFLEMVKGQKSSGKQEMREVFKRLYDYRQRLLDSVLAKMIGRSESLQKEVFEIKKKMPLFQGYDGLTGVRLDAAAESWADSNANAREPLLVTITLNRLENEVLLTARPMLLCCNEIPRMRHDYQEAHLITQLSSSYVRSGEFVEITAGIGLFSYRMAPHFFIDGKELKSDDRPILVHRVQANGKPGKQRIALRASYYLPDGSQVWMDRTLEYTISR